MGYISVMFDHEECNMSTFPEGRGGKVAEAESGPPQDVHRNIVGFHD